MTLVPVPTDFKPICGSFDHLVDKLAELFGVVTEPKRIQKIADAQAYATRSAARAETDALLIRAEGQIQLSEIKRRALRRVAYEAARDQENIEAIAGKALGLLQTESNQPQSQLPSDDWLVFLMNRGKEIADDDIQNLFAKVLAGEVTKPGSYSKQTISILATLDQPTADLFNRLSHYVWTIENELIPVVFFYDEEQRFLLQNVITIASMQELESFGLVTASINGAITIDNNSRYVEVEYFGSKTQISKYTPWFNKSMVRFTRAGLELYRCCEPHRVNGYEEHVIAVWKKDQNGHRQTEEQNGAFFDW